jgi:GNAT superfamily N-acetyltransferase
MGFRYTATHQDDETTLKRLKKGWPLVAEHDGRIVGTITLYPPAPDSRCECYKNTHHFGQFGVHPAYQQRGIGLKLLQLVEQRAREEAATSLALDTAEGAEHLRQWYGSLGYSFVEYVTWGTVNYRSVILAKNLALPPLPP